MLYKRNSIFYVRKYNLYNNHNKHKVCLPKIKNVNLIILNKINDLEKLEKNKYEFLTSSFNSFLSFIKSGLICFLFEHNKKIIHENWLAMNKNAVKSFETWFHDINFDKSAVWGGAQTHKDYLKKGLYHASQSNIYNFLIKSGIEYNNFSVWSGNYSGNISVKKFKPRIYKNGYMIKIFNKNIFKWSVIKKDNE